MSSFPFFRKTLKIYFYHDFFPDKIYLFIHQFNDVKMVVTLSS